MSLADALAELRAALVGTGLTLDVAGADGARRDRDQLVGQLDDYLLPRLADIDAPLLVVVGGSTGAGKSTLVNTLVGADVTASGVLRPTTRAPVVVCNPADEARFAAGGRVLPGLARTTGPAAGDSRSLTLVSTDAVPPGLALLDAPDIDSVVETNRTLAAQLLAAADLWLFVTTAARYADAVPWDLLHQAADRSTALAIVLNRVPPEATGEVADHLRAMLADNGLSRAPVFAVPELALDGGRLPAAAAAEVRRWLDDLAADAGKRAAVVRATLEGALDSLPPRAATVAAAADAQLAAARSLADDPGRAYAAARAEVEEGLASGTLLRSEVLARWQELVGTGELMRSVETAVSRIRDRVRSVFSGQPRPEAEVREALGSGVQALVIGAGDRAAERSLEAWEGSPPGRQLLDRLDAGQPGSPPQASARRRRRLARSSPALADEAAREIRAWQGGVLDLVRAEVGNKRSAARALSLGVNGTGVAVMIAVFAQTGGITGAEVAVAGGTAAVSQKLLEAIFGDQAIRSLAATARFDLLERVDRLMAGEAARFTALLPAPADGDGERLRRAAAAVRAAR